MTHHGTSKSTCFLLSFLPGDGLGEFMHFAHEHGKRGIVSSEKIHHLVQRHVCNQVAAHHQDVCLKTNNRNLYVWLDCLSKMNVFLFNK